MSNRVDALRARMQAHHAPVSGTMDSGHLAHIAQYHRDLAALLAVYDAASDLDPCDQGDGSGKPYCYTHHTGRPCCGDALRAALAACEGEEA